MKNDVIQNPIYARQIAFVCAFLLPASKLLELPSLLSKYAKGDLLFPAFLHFLLQAGVLLALLWALSQTEYTLLQRLKAAFGKGVVVVYILYGAYFIFSAILPLLDAEKFSYAAFFDTSPTTFSFVAFFFFSAFVCIKGVKAVGRFADLCLILFLLPFLALLFMSFGEADFSNLLPFFGTRFEDTMYAFTRATPHFSDVVLLLPLFANFRYQKGDGKKIMAGYGVGAALSLLFLAVFYGVYGALAPREHYGFIKIAQYFPALTVVGRIDLLFIYLLSVVLLFYTCLPLQYIVASGAEVWRTIAPNGKQPSKILLSAFLNGGFLLFVLFGNQHYNALYQAISGRCFPIFFLIADLLPLCALALPKTLQNKKESSYV